MQLVVRLGTSSNAQAIHILHAYQQVNIWCQRPTLVFLSVLPFDLNIRRGVPIANCRSPTYMRMYFRYLKICIRYSFILLFFIFIRQHQYRIYEGPVSIEKRCQGPQDFPLIYSGTQLTSYPTPKNNTLHLFHLIVNIFHISVCPASNPWPYMKGEKCCDHEVEYKYNGVEAGNCRGDNIKCPSHPLLPCAAGNYLLFATFVNVSVCFRYTAYFIRITNLNLSLNYLLKICPKNEASDSQKKKV